MEKKEKQHRKKEKIHKGQKYLKPSRQKKPFTHKRKQPEISERKSPSNSPIKQKKRKISEKVDADAEKNTKIERFNINKRSRTQLSAYLTACVQNELQPKADNFNITPSHIIKNINTTLPTKNTLAQLISLFLEQSLEKNKFDISNNYSEGHIIILMNDSLKVVGTFREILQVITDKFFTKSEMEVEIRIHKLLSKHKKIKLQIDDLKRKPIKEGVVNVMVATTNRLNKLIENGAIKLENLRYIVIDSTPNEKNQSIFDMNVIRQDLYYFLFNYAFANPRPKTPKIYIY